MESVISFILDGEVASVDFSKSGELTPTTTVLNYLRGLPHHKGVKEGCAEGDCGACTLVIGECVSPKGSFRTGNKLRYKSVDSCLMFLPMLHGKQLITVENLRDQSGRYHPVQKSMVEMNGSQCGYCTPGFVMSLFALYKNDDRPSRESIDDALTGNLCRCTGYKPIVEAAASSSVHSGMDHFSENERRMVELMNSLPRTSLHCSSGRQTYLRPVSIQEAIVARHARPDALIVAGGTDVALRVTKNHELLEEIIDLSGIEELKDISETDTALVVGAGAALSDVAMKAQQTHPALVEMLAVFGSLQIRNIATLGGNLGTASPIGDTLPVLMAYDARVVLESLHGKREIPMNAYFTGYRKSVRKQDEIITAVILPKPAKNVIVKSYKISKRKDLDISTLSACFRLQLNSDRSVDNILLAYGGMAERTKRAAATEEFLFGKRWERKIVEEAMPRLDKDFSPISDVRGGSEMRRIAAKNLLLKFWSDTSPR